MHRSFYTKILHTEKFIPIEAFTYRRFYAKKLLHTETFAQKLCTQKFSHKKNFTQRNFYTKKLVRTDVLTHSSFYAKKLLHREVFTHLSSCLIFHDHSPSVIFISLFSCSFVQLLSSFSFHFARYSVRPRLVLAAPAAKQTKREPRNNSD